jgi:hypothetical protein
VYVPNDRELKLAILKEMHNVTYAGHPGYQKTVAAVKSHYFWPGMKKEIAEYIARCMECQKVKAEHRHPAGLLQPLPIPEWKWEVITMDFIMGLPRTSKQHDSIMVVVDKLTKAAHFIPLKTTHRAADVADIFLKKLHACMEFLRQLCLIGTQNSLEFLERTVQRIRNESELQYNIPSRV